MICCNDEYLKEDALKYFCHFMKFFINISICHFSDIPCGHSLTINPTVLVDALIIILSQEKDAIFRFGLLATNMFIQELHIIIGRSVCIDYSTSKILL